MHASWSPDGKRIAYMEEHIIWRIDADGSNKYQLSKEKVLDAVERLCDKDGKLIIENGKVKCRYEERFVDEDPIWSPKGDLIAFVCKGWIWVMNPDGEGRKKVCEESYLVDWTPDGNKLMLSRSIVDLEGNLIKELPVCGYISSDEKMILRKYFSVWDIEREEKIDLFANRTRKGKHFVYKRPDSIW
jgi:Tol biopolymer transport system component